LLCYQLREDFIHYALMGCEQMLLLILQSVNSTTRLYLLLGDTLSIDSAHLLTYLI
jgi:hypothetical protein